MPPSTVGVHPTRKELAILILWLMLQCFVASGGIHQPCVCMHYDASTCVDDRIETGSKGPLYSAGFSPANHLLTPMPHILGMSVNPDTELRDRSCAPCANSPLTISCCGLCAFWVRVSAKPQSFPGFKRVETTERKVQCMSQITLPS